MALAQQSGPDAVVIGSGPNGLVAANLLCDAGWSVTVLEAQPRIGGAVASDQDVAGGFVHDTFSSFYPLGAASPVLASLELERWGLTWVHAPAVIGSPSPGGGWALLHRDPQQTAESLDTLSPGDGQAWLDLYDTWRRIGPSVVDALLSPFPPIRASTKLLTALPRSGGLATVRMLLESARSLAETRLTGSAAQMLIAGNAAHADLSPDAAGSGLFGLLMAMLGQDVGFPVPRGGAGELAAAAANRLRAGGGQILCDRQVTRILIDRGRATGVVTADGEVLTARRAVIADVSAPALYGGLVGWDQLPRSTRQGMQRFQFDPGTIKVDWALSGPVPWEPGPHTQPGTIHLADSITDLSVWMAQVTGHAVPADPFLLIGQMSTTDPTRSPPGTEALWAYTRVPQRVLHDAGATGTNGAITGAWGHADAQRMADRMQARIERYAPGFGDRVIARRILGPTDLEQRNANLVGGAIGGGTSALHQQLIFRPIPGSGRAGTPIKGLFLGSSAAHPGGGVHGACGANAARAALRHDRFTRRRG